ncbi:sugar phosphate isomerase/epimerase [Candidatus Woesearchaeota archaeon]|nr:sugar phosphate isomerase/epimerase [Candidatus Woesearchaeota archaeon]
MKYINKFVDEVKNQVKYYEEGSISYGKNEEEIKKEITNIETIKTYALKKTADTLSTAAIYAYDKERAQKLEKPLFIAPENLFPEGGFGGHPQDLKEIIVETREAMAKKLVEERKMNPEEANKIAQDHIKATFDIGHAYTWRKFFQTKPGESIEETDKRFKDYLMSEIKKLSDEGIIGHVHLADNFGYYDEHVTPGMGKAPIPEFVKQMQESGFKGAMITEPGSQDIQAMLGTWRILNSPVYRIDLTSRSWTDVEGSYFGRTGSPNYIVGDYAPSEDWTLWSGARLE